MDDVVVSGLNVTSRPAPVEESDVITSSSAHATVADDVEFADDDDMFYDASDSLTPSSVDEGKVCLT